MGGAAPNPAPAGGAGSGKVLLRIEYISDAQAKLVVLGPIVAVSLAIGLLAWRPRSSSTRRVPSASSMRGERAGPVGAAGRRAAITSSCLFTRRHRRRVPRPPAGPSPSMLCLHAGPGLVLEEQLLGGRLLRVCGGLPCCVPSDAGRAGQERAARPPPALVAAAQKGGGLCHPAPAAGDGQPQLLADQHAAVLDPPLLLVSHPK